MSKKLLEAWVEAGLPDDEESLVKYKVTPKLLKKLEKRVFKAIAAKMLEAPGVTTFAQHRTIQ